MKQNALLAVANNHFHALQFVDRSKRLNAAEEAIHFASGWLCCAFELGVIDADILDFWMYGYTWMIEVDATPRIMHGARGVL